MKVFLIDNYDSFTYNLYQLFGSFDGVQVEVYRNDEITFQEIINAEPDCIVLSPGPGNPRYDSDFGVCVDILMDQSHSIPIFGVCLGMQGIGLYSGGEIISASRIYHGKTSRIIHSGNGIFNAIPQDIKVARYHSLIINEQNLPPELRVTAATKNNEIMAVEHRDLPIYGVQFHPESFMTEYGKELVQNFLEIVQQRIILVEA